MIDLACLGTGPVQSWYRQIDTVKPAKMPKNKAFCKGGTGGTPYFEVRKISHVYLNMKFACTGCT